MAAARSNHNNYYIDIIYGVTLSPAALTSGRHGQNEFHELINDHFATNGACLDPFLCLLGC